MDKLLPLDQSHALHDEASSRAVEAWALARNPDLMQAAGLAVAKLALALYPGQGCIWVACGPGNNGGDGRVAARHLQALNLPVSVADEPPDGVSLVIDALFGLGLKRPLEGAYAQRVASINSLDAVVLAVDLPSGLNCNTGMPMGTAVRADHTLALLTLKPGLLTGAGRAYAGSLWVDTLGESSGHPATALLIGRECLSPWRWRDPLAHKGTQGDVQVAAGGMPGAARLAARAALAAGAGRVFSEIEDVLQPELLHWDRLAMNTVVAGCGGAALIAARLPDLLEGAQRLVLDADALNAIAQNAALAQALRERGKPTLVTPHPLEAARLLGTTVAEVQADRLRAAAAMAASLNCTVALKGSGTVIAAPGRTPCINSSGGPALATAGSGDVLAGWAGGLWAQAPQLDAFEIACAAVHWHGLAGQTQQQGPLPAHRLIERMSELRI